MLDVHDYWKKKAWVMIGINGLAKSPRGERVSMEIIRRDYLSIAEFVDAAIGFQGEPYDSQIIELLWDYFNSLEFISKQRGKYPNIIVMKIRSQGLIKEYFVIFVRKSFKIPKEIMQVIEKIIKEEDHYESHLKFNPDVRKRRKINAL